MIKFGFVFDEPQTNILEFEYSKKYTWKEDIGYADIEFIPNLTFYRYHNYGKTIKCYKFKAVRETKKGYWILDGNIEKWISKTTKKRFAYPTRKEAWRNFEARKIKQRKILKDNLYTIEHVLKSIKNIGEIE